MKLNTLSNTKCETEAWQTSHQNEAYLAIHQITQNQNAKEHRRLRISERVNTPLDRSYHRGTCIDTDSDAKSNLNHKENTTTME